MVIGALKLGTTLTYAATNFSLGGPVSEAQQSYRPTSGTGPTVERTITLAQANTSQVPFTSNGWCPFSTVPGQTWWQVRDRTGIINLLPARVPAANETNPRVCVDNAPDLTGINSQGLTPQTLINGLGRQLLNTRQDYLNQLRNLRNDNDVRNAILRTLLGNAQGVRFDNWRRQAQNQNIHGERLRALYREIATGLTTYRLQFQTELNGQIVERTVP